MIIEQFAQYLQDKGLGTLNRNIFCFRMPAEITNGYLIVYPNDGIRLDPELKGYYQDIFPFIIRGASLTEVTRLADAAMNVVDALHVEAGGFHFNYIRPLSLPIIYPPNDGNTYEAGISIEFSGYMVKATK